MLVWVSLLMPFHMEEACSMSTLALAITSLLFHRFPAWLREFWAFPSLRFWSWITIMVLLSTPGKSGTWGHGRLMEFLVAFEFKSWKYPRYLSIYPSHCPASGNCKEGSDKFILILIFPTNPRESLNMWPSFYFWNIMVLILFLFQFCLNSNWGLDTAI